MTIEQLRKYRKIKGKMLLRKSELDDLILKSNVNDGTGCKGNKTSDTVANIVQEREKIYAEIQSLERKLLEVESYINECEEYYGTMLRLHYIKGAVDSDSNENGWE